MLYLNLDPDFPDHPKTIRMIALAGDSSYRCLQKLWSFSYKFHPKDGDLATYSDPEIESLAGWAGEPGKLIKTLLAVKFLDRKKTGELSLHDWSEHEGHVAAIKDRNKQNALSRWKNYRKVSTSGSAKSDTTVIPVAVPKDDSGNAPTYLPTLPTNNKLDGTEKVDDLATTSPNGSQHELTDEERELAQEKIANLIHRKPEPYTAGDCVKAIKDYLKKLIPTAEQNDIGSAAGKVFEGIRFYALGIKKWDNSGPEPRWYVFVLKQGIGDPDEWPAEKIRPKDIREFYQFLGQILKPENGDCLHEWCSNAHKLVRRN